MKQLSLILLLLFSATCWSADWKKGYAAFEGGDYATALKEWTPLAEQGDAVAPFNLGQMYRNGQGVIQDNIYAHMWWNIAASSGNKDAITNRDIVAERMTSFQLEKAQDLARECVAKNYKGC